MGAYTSALFVPLTVKNRQRMMVLAKEKKETNLTMVEILANLPSVCRAIERNVRHCRCDYKQGVLHA